MKTRYNDWRVAVVDEKGHRVIQENDAFGRLIGMKEYTGVFSEPHWDAALYATTVYTYDVRDLLVQVQDAANNRTTITYDRSGRRQG